MSSEENEVPVSEPHLAVPNVATYIAGFVVAAALTIVAFLATSVDWLDKGTIIGLVAVLAAIQALVHIRFFLHWSSERTPIEATLALVFSAIVTTIMIGGSMWVMYDLHHRMMP